MRQGDRQSDKVPVPLLHYNINKTIENVEIMQKIRYNY